MLALAIGLGTASPPAEAARARDVFRDHADLVLQVQVIDLASSAKRGIGSGFAAAADGRIVTNYHVVAETVHRPERYRIEVLDRAETRYEATLLAFDPVADLAVLKTERTTERFVAFREEAEPPAAGSAIHALGNPLDIGLSIVSGTYNGRLENAFLERIHFTGSLNPGMSGGPALDDAGRLIGVNVSTSGDDVSFLVPAGEVRALLERAPDPDHRASLRRQLLGYQERFVEAILAEPFETARIGPFVVPGRLAPFFSCWGDTESEDDWLYQLAYQTCATEDQIYLSEDHTYEWIHVSHDRVSSERLGAVRFHSLHTWFFEDNELALDGDEDDLTAFRCNTRFVEQGGLLWKTALCARRYKRIEGLFDVVLKAASLGHDQEALNTTLTLSGVSFESGERLARRYLESLAWKE